MKTLFVLMLLVLIPIVLCNSAFLRLLVFHPVSTVWYLIRDVLLYFVQRRYDLYDGGLLNCYFAHFGGGKTLSVTHFIRKLFKRYNNKKVWDRGQKRFVLQKVHIISNVHLNGIPYEPLQSLSQVVCCAWKNKKIDVENKTRTVVLVLLDEASSQLNSRAFKTNIDANFLNTLITSRHFHMSIYYTSQKFKLVDALLRSVTQRCIWCRKIWRFMLTYYYDADELEYAPNPSIVKPYKRTGFIIRNKDYNSYDTLATVEQLQKSVNENDMMSEKEILELRGAMNPDVDAITPTRKFMRRKRKM